MRHYNIYDPDYGSLEMCLNLDISLFDEWESNTWYQIYFRHSYQVDYYRVGRRSKHLEYIEELLYQGPLWEKYVFGYDPFYKWLASLISFRMSCICPKSLARHLYIKWINKCKSVASFPLIFKMPNSFPDVYDTNELKYYVAVPVSPPIDFWFYLQEIGIVKDENFTCSCRPEFMGSTNYFRMVNKKRLAKHKAELLEKNIKLSKPPEKAEPFHPVIPAETTDFRHFLQEEFLHHDLSYLWPGASRPQGATVHVFGRSGGK